MQTWILPTRLFLLCALTSVPVGLCANEADSDVQSRGRVLIGFNSKWSYIPAPHEAGYDAFVRNVRSLEPRALRYPGGTITHRWDWRTGAIESRKKGTVVNPIEHLTQLVDHTEVEIVFVLDIVRRSLEDQVAMLKASKLPVKYVELGNEIYSGEYKEEFPTGRDYAERVNRWVPELRKAFPGLKLSVTLLGRTPVGPRLAKWNKLVTKTVQDVDAYTYHIYAKGGVSVADRIAEYERNRIETEGVEIWITEYGIQDEAELSSSAYKNHVRRLDELRQYVEANSRIALCHILTTNNFTPKSANFSAISYGGSSLTPVGEYFRDLAVSRGPSLSNPNEAR